MRFTEQEHAVLSEAAAQLAQVFQAEQDRFWQVVEQFRASLSRSPVEVALEWAQEQTDWLGSVSGTQQEAN